MVHRSSGNFSGPEFVTIPGLHRTTIVRACGAALRPGNEGFHPADLFDHPIRERKQVGWNLASNCLCGFEVEY